MEQQFTKGIVGKIAYLIGVSRENITANYLTEAPNLFDELDPNPAARNIRSLCKLRMTLMRHFKDVDTAMRYELKNLDSIEFFDKTDIETLEHSGISVIKVNYRSEKYLSDLNNLILNNIDKCRDLFPEWISWEYLRELFIIQKGSNPEYTKRASFKYINNIKNYPFQCYINWEPGEYGNILHNDSKFVRLLYEIHGDTFRDSSKVRDAGENTKTSIYDFIQNSESTAIIADCENSDVYKLYSVIKNLNRDELDKVKKIILYDDIHTTRAWALLEKVMDIPVEYNQVNRVNELKSLVDIKMTAGTCREFYQNGIKSFILASSDSDFWGLISSLPEAEFLVLMEYEKCGRDIKEALDMRGIYYCAMDDFCSGNINDLKELALVSELENRLKGAVSLNADTLLADIYRECRINAGETEKSAFYNKYLKTIALQIDEKGDFRLCIKRK